MSTSSITTVVYVNDDAGLLDTFGCLITERGVLACDQLIMMSGGSESLSFGKYQQVIETGVTNGSVVMLTLTEEHRMAALSAALTETSSNFVLFMEAGDAVSDNFFEVVRAALDAMKIEHFLATPVHYLHRPELGFPNTNKFKFNETSKHFKLALQPTKIQTTFCGVVFKTDRLRAVLRRKSNRTQDEVVVLTEMIENEVSYGAINNVTYFVGKLKAFEDSMDSEQKDREWVAHQMSLLECLLEKRMTVYRKHVVAYLLNELIQAANFKRDYLGDFPVELMQKRFMNLFGLVDQEIIFSPFLHRDFRYWLLQENGILCSRLNDRQNGNILVYSGDEVVFSLRQYEVFVQHIEVRENHLHVMGHFNNCAELPIENLSVSLLSQSNKRCFATISPYTKKDRACFGKTIFQCFAIEIVVPLEELVENEFTFQFRFNNIPVEANIRYSFKSGLYHYDRMYAFHKDWLIEKSGNSQVKVIPYTKEKVLALESSLVAELTDNSQQNIMPQIQLRQQFIDSIPDCFSRRIWLFFDRGSRADDNAEHLFKYSMQQDDGIEKYYCIDKECPDFNRLKEDFGDAIIEYLSDEFFLLWFSSERIISSHLHLTKSFCEQFKYYSGFLTTRQTMIQHGIILYSLPVLYDQIAHNFAMFTASTVGEYDHILNDSINFNEELLKLTGLARFDNLESAPKKNILVSFTWRQYLVTKKQADWTRKYNESFIDTNYFQGMYKLFTDPVLTQFMRDNGYSFSFRPHPNVYQQIADFEETDTFKIIPDEVSYQTLYKESALMITDYSSAVFDFAYLKKPIIYYQYEPILKEKGYFDFEKDGFGEVITNHDEMVQLLIEYIENNCDIKAHYRDRIDRFFNWDDRQNCARIYHEMTNTDPHKLIATSVDIAPYKLQTSGQFTPDGEVQFLVDHYGGSGVCTFAWEIFDDLNVRRVITKYTSERYFLWRPPAKGKYKVKVYAKDSNGKKSSRYYGEVVITE